MTPPLEPRERLAALIRKVDGHHALGAAALADALLAHGVTLADAVPSGFQLYLHVSTPAFQGGYGRVEIQRLLRVVADRLDGGETLPFMIYNRHGNAAGRAVLSGGDR